MNMSTTTLPTQPSELIRLALADLRAIEDDDCYAVDMKEWHTPVYTYDYEVCHVCLAGAVLAQTLGLPDDVEIEDDDLSGYGSSVEDGLWALDCFRLGRIGSGLRWMNFDLSALDKNWEQFASVVEYDPADPDKFHSQMNDLADYLASQGL